MRPRLIKASNNSLYVKFMQLEIGLFMTAYSIPKVCSGSVFNHSPSINFEEKITCVHEEAKVIHKFLFK